MTIIKPSHIYMLCDLKNTGSLNYADIPSGATFHYKKIFLIFIYFWLHWVPVAACRILRYGTWA